MIKVIISFMLFLMVIFSFFAFMNGYHKGIRDSAVIIQTDESVIDAACRLHGVKEAIYHRSEDGNPGYFFFYKDQVNIPNPEGRKWASLFNLYFREKYHSEVVWKMKQSKAENSKGEENGKDL